MKNMVTNKDLDRFITSLGAPSKSNNKGPVDKRSIAFLIGYLDEMNLLPDNEDITHSVQDEVLNTRVDLIPTEDLEQYGKKGMKWGIRKDKTGSSKSSAKSMSDKELKDAVARMNLERSYNKLLADKSPSSTTSRGAKIVGGMIGNAAKQAAQNYMQQAFSAAIKAGVTAAVKKAGGSLPDFPKDD